jgi:hypothetical protein
MIHNYGLRFGGQRLNSGIRMTTAGLGTLALGTIGKGVCIIIWGLPTPNFSTMKLLLGLHYYLILDPCVAS